MSARNLQLQGVEVSCQEDSTTSQTNMAENQANIACKAIRGEMRCAYDWVMRGYFIGL
jgi:hypothetical protein